jgi:hypothetical protein
MSRFHAVLRRTAARLDLPQPAKSHVLLEMAADLEDLYAVYRGRGLDEQEALRRVEERLDVADEALAELIRVHSSGFRRWLDRLSEQAQTRWERVLLGLVLLFAAVTAAGSLSSGTFLREASIFAWPGVAIGLVAAGILLAKGYRLYLKKDHAIRRLRRGLPSLLLLTGASLFNGLFGYLLGLHLVMERIAVDPEAAGLHMMRWLVGSTTTMIVSLLVAILTAIAWFVLMNKVRRIELAEAALMLEEPQ